MTSSMPMTGSPPPRQAGARITRQERSAYRQRRIVDAAIGIVAERGLAGLTHRQIAAQAGLSLAATTYYYAAKSDIVGAASDRLLANYVESFRRFAERNRGRTDMTFRDFVLRLLGNAAAGNRAATLAWCEIILDAARHADTQALARSWFGNLAAIWTGIAEMLGADAPAGTARSAIDVLLGLLFVTLPLGLSPAEAMAVLAGGADPESAWLGDQEQLAAEREPRTRKFEATRARIVAAAAALITAEGSDAVTYRAVAARAGLTPAAPTYQFPTVTALVAAAQAQVFEQAKQRYRQVVAGIGHARLDLDRVIDLTTAVFLREVTQFGANSLATFPIRLQAARDPELRPIVAAMVADQHRAWRRLLAPLADGQRPIDALLAQSLFAGKLIRILATGVDTLDLASVRGEFAADLRAICEGRYWI